MILAPVSYRRLRGLGDAAADIEAQIAAQIVCCAREWVGATESPAGSNRGGRIDEIHRLYRGTAYKGTEAATALPYCAEWVWVVIDCAVRRLVNAGGLKNPLPGYASALGNTLRTLDGARASGVPINAAPRPGCAFWRQPTGGSSSAASGHMGIVVAVYADGGFATIEANQGNTNGVYAFTYKAADIAAQKFQFLHVQKMPAPASTRAAIGCAGPVPTPQGGASSGVTSPPSGSGGGVSVAATARGTSSGGATSRGSGSGTLATPSTPTAKPCDWTIPPLSSIPHYSVLQDPRIAADIMAPEGWFFDALGKRPDLRGLQPSGYNGLAMGALSGSNQYKAHSGIGLFRDRVGNVIFCVSESEGDNGMQPCDAYKILLDNQLTGRRGHWTWKGKTGKGAGWLEAATAMWMGADGCLKAFGETGPYLRGQATWVRWEDNVTEGGGELDWTKRYNRPMDVMIEMEKRGTRLDRPIVFVLSHAPGMTWKKATSIAIDIAKMVVTSAMPYIGSFLGDVFGKVVGDALMKLGQKIIDLAVSGRKFTIGEMLPLLRDVADCIIPPEVRKTLIAGTPVGAIAQDVEGFIRRGGAEIQRVVDTLKIDLRQFGGSALDVVRNIEAGNIAKLAASSGIPFDAINSLLQNTGAINLIGAITRKSESGSLVASIVDAGSIVQTADLRKLVLSGAASTILSAVPNAAKVAGEVVRGTIECDWTPYGQELTAAFNKVAQGRPVAGVVFDELLKNSLVQQANELLQGGTRQMILPASVPARLRDCLSFEVSKTGIQVLIQGTGSISGGSRTTINGSNVSVVGPAPTVRITPGVDLRPTPTVTVQPTPPPVVLRPIPPVNVQPTPPPVVLRPTPPPVVTPRADVPRYDDGGDGTSGGGNIIITPDWRSTPPDVQPPVVQPPVVQPPVVQPPVPPVIIEQDQTQTQTLTSTPVERITMQERPMERPTIIVPPTIVQPAPPPVIQGPMSPPVIQVPAAPPMIQGPVPTYPYPAYPPGYPAWPPPAPWHPHPSWCGCNTCNSGGDCGCGCGGGCGCNDDVGVFDQFAGA